MTTPTPAQIKQARSDAGLTQQAMADKLGITLRGYQNYEYAERKIPPPTWQLMQIFADQAV